MKISRYTFNTLALVFLVCAAARGATTNTTLTVTGSGTLSPTTLSATVTGTATLTNIGNGTFSSTVSLTSISGTNVNVPFTITLSGGTLTGTLVVPLSLLTAGSGTSSGTGSATITGGTGTYSGATGTFPTLTGQGSLNATTFAVSFSFTGAGSITTGGTPAPPTPTITTVASSADYSTTIAQGSLFIVKGANLSASGNAFSSYPLPTTANGVTVTFTPASGGTGTPAYLVYLINQPGVNQLGAVLPSTLAAGNYNVTVTNNGAVSAPFAATVVQRRFEVFTQDASGAGLAIVQNFISASQLDYNRFTTGSLSTGYTISPAKPGQTLIAWGTGMGPVTGGDNGPSLGFNFAANGVNVQVVVGGMSITPAYAGRAPGFSGEDQINFTLPPNVPTGCTVSFQVSVNGALSAPTFISIAPTASASACVSPAFTTAQLQNFDQGGTYTTGGFDLLRISETLPSIGSVTSATASGAFTQYSGFQLGAIPPLATLVLNPSGACLVIPLVSSSSTPSISGTGTNLDAGTVTLNGPSGSNITNVALTETSNTYYSLLGETGLPSGTPGVGNGTIVAGTYTLNGAGGKDVGKFSASLTLGTPLTITGGLPTVVTRSAGLTLNWTGGNATDLVEIAGEAATSSGTGANVTSTGAEFVCTTTAGAGTFTVPASILLQLPAVTASAIAGSSASSFLELFSIGNPTTGSGVFSAPLTAGGTVSATFLSLLGTGSTPAYQ